MSDLPDFIILASSSPRRASLLKEMGIDFRVVPSGAREVNDADIDARDLCRRNALLKTMWVAEQYPDQIVLGADTLVFKDKEIFGKPSSMVEAVEMLERLQGTKHQVVTAFCLMRLRPNNESCLDEVTKVWMKALHREQIQSYFKLVDPLDKAGSYAIQEHGDLIIEKIDGSLSNVIGLPIEKLAAELKSWV